jgi:hypothetical protein
MGGKVLVNNAWVAFDPAGVDESFKSRTLDAEQALRGLPFEIFAVCCCQHSYERKFFRDVEEWILEIDSGWFSHLITCQSLGLQRTTYAMGLVRARL